jgi:poly(A)-specific ribonuclease
MELDRTSFYTQLPAILSALATSAAVVIDCELSGISRLERGLNNRQTLQERYADRRQAAQRYSILQFGITILQSLDRDKAQARTFNLNIDPKISKTLEMHLAMDRDLTIQGSAARFLTDEGFAMGALFHKGVQYLSRSEEEEAVEAAKALSEQPEPRKKDHRKLSETEGEAISFTHLTRNKIIEWEKLSKRETLQISGPLGKLTGYQRKLVHQLIVHEFPHLKACRNDSGMVICPLDRETEKNRNERFQQSNMEHIKYHVGLRWIIEAICGSRGRFDALDGQWLAAKSRQQGEVKERQFTSVLKQLKSRKDPILVAGHNLWNDLIYLYQCFLGDLPTDVDDFGKAIAHLFPRVLDTKFLATRKTGDVPQHSSLLEVSTRFPDMTKLPPS